MHSQAVGMQKLSDFPQLPSNSTSAIPNASIPYESPGEILNS